MGWLSSLFGGSKGGAPKQGSTETVAGFSVTPEPLPRDGQFLTAGIIFKGEGESRREHRFIRADVHPTFEQACAHSLQKAEQIIKEQGDRLFD
ncbi:MAG: HlyU family transcriptional regulator [Pseudomonadota bacterium]